MANFCHVCNKGPATGNRVSNANNRRKRRFMPNLQRVRIQENGDLIDATVSRSSGSAILDLASVDIIQRASPFDEFPAAMAAAYDTVAFEYKFLFTEQLVRAD